MGKFKGILNDLKAFIVKNSPELLTGMGIAGFISATVMAVKATPKALKLIEQEKKIEDVDKLTAKDTLKATWKCYIPSAIVTVASGACIVGATSISQKRNAALATIYALTESTLKDYQEKVVEAIGSDKEKEIREKVNEKQREPETIRQEIILTEEGNTLFKDESSGRYLKSDINFINAAINELNKKLLYDGVVTLNEYYYELGLPSTSTGETMGWKVDDGLISISFTPKILSKGKMYATISFHKEPKSI